MEIIGQSNGLDAPRTTYMGGGTMLHRAAYSGDIETVIGLLKLAKEEKTLEPFVQKDGVGRTALHLAVMEGRIEVVQALVNAVKERQPETWLAIADDQEGNTALHFAFRTNNVSYSSRRGTAWGFDGQRSLCLSMVVAILDAAGTSDDKFALISTQNKAGLTVLHQAVTMGLEEVALLLDPADTLEHQKTLLFDIRDARGNNALHLAASNWSLLKLLEIIQDRGRGAWAPLLNLRNSSDLTPMDLCKMETAPILFEAGADLNATFMRVKADMTLDAEVRARSTFYRAFDSRFSAELRAALERAGVHIPSMARWVDRRLRSPMSRLIGAVGQVIANGREHRPKRTMGEANPAFQPEAECGAKSLHVEIAARSYLRLLRRFPRFKRPEVLQSAMDLLDEPIRRGSEISDRIRVFVFAHRSTAHSPLRL